jgi:hypothetical protein
MVPLVLLPMYQFHISVHRRPPGDLKRQPVDLAAGRYQTLHLEPQQVTEPMTVCFEDACAKLSGFPQMFVEPDGSFVWTSPQADSAWQIDGVIYDRHDRLLFVDLKGSCPSEAFDRLLRVFGWPETAMVFQLAREAIYLDETEFRRFADRT